MAVITCECMQFELFSKIVSTSKYQCWVSNEGTKREIVWENTNKLLRRKHFIGGKTGVTVTAGPCLASVYEIGDVKLVTILLRTSKLSRRFTETRLILA